MSAVKITLQEESYGFQISRPTIRVDGKLVGYRLGLESPERVKEMLENLLNALAVVNVIVEIK